MINTNKKKHIMIILSITMNQSERLLIFGIRSILGFERLNYTKVYSL